MVFFKHDVIIGFFWMADGKSIISMDGFSASWDPIISKLGFEKAELLVTHHLMVIDGDYGNGYINPKPILSGGT